MSNNNPTLPVIEDFKEPGLKNNLSKFDHDLYHEEDDISEKVIRVKKVSMPNNGSKWKIMVDNKIVFTIESTKISKKEKDFLGTIDGFNYILQQAKAGIKSLNAFRTELKYIIENKPEEKIVKKQKKAKKK